MCGIAGYIDTRRASSAPDLVATANGMARALEHRGPDDAGVWTDAAHGVALASRRLAILDPSEAGHQPMVSVDGRYVLVFNGEIHNYRELRREAAAAASAAFRGGSDTESLLAGFVAWGIEPTVRRAAGSFAFAVWDRETHTLTLGRDRIGEKPLVYGWCGSSFVFASEVGAIRRHPQFRAEIDRDALARYFRYRYVPAPDTIFRGVRKLPPASLLRVELDRMVIGETRPPTTYWSLLEVAAEARVRPFTGSAHEAQQALAAQLEPTVAEQMVADVPLGAFLSGGVDSSAIVALMQKVATEPVKTFTVGFAESAYDEAPYARAIAQHLGTEHTELRLTPREVMETVPTLGQRFDEPFADSSQIPMVLISTLAKRQVTVSLSGDGGDEVFGGYNRYLGGYQTWCRLQRGPAALRRVASRMLLKVPPGWWDRGMRLGAPVLPESVRVREPADKVAKLAQVMAPAQGTPARYYASLLSEWPEPERLVVGTSAPVTSLVDPSVWDAFDDPRQAIMYLDTTTYLPGDGLTKVDRASMSVGLEARAPLLDHRVVELAWRMPIDMHITGRRGKQLLRSVLYDHVPRELIERPKTGFAIPLGDWLRGPLRPWADDLLQASTLREQGYLHPGPVHDLWRDHLAGARNHQHRLWTVLMFQLWLDTQ